MSVRGQYPCGLEKIESAISALDTVRSMCGQPDCLDHVSGDGIASLLHFVLCGFEEGVEEQRDEERKDKKQLEVLARKIEALSGRLFLARKLRVDQVKSKQTKEAMKPIILQFIEEAKAEQAEEDAFAAEVASLLNMGDAA